MEHIRLHSRARAGTARYIFMTVLLLLCAAASTVAATTITVQDTEELKAALGQRAPFGSVTAPAGPGDTIVLIAGRTYSGTFILPNLNNPNGEFITIRSSDMSSLPGDGRRVSPADQPHMPTINAPRALPALVTAAGASHYRIIGIEFTFPDQPDMFVHDIIRLGESTYTSDAQSPSSIVIDRCYVHGRQFLGSQRGITLNSRETSVINSYISDIHWDVEAQGIGGWNGRGPFHIVNNHVEAAGQNVMFGGARPSIPGLVPSNIEVRRNHLLKPTKWRPGSADYDGTNWRVKNILEFKSAKHAFVEGNLMENAWSEEGYGAINLYEDNDSGDQVTLQHITITNNIVRNTGYGVLVTGRASNGPSVQGYDIKIVHNLFYNITRDWGGQFGTFMEVNSINDLVIDHNTIIQNFYLVAFQSPIVPGTKMTGFVFTNNMTTYGSFGFFANEGGFAEGGFAANLINPVLNRNVFIDPNQHQNEYPTYASLNFWPLSIADVGFVNAAGGNYALAPNTPYKGQSLDGGDIGADMEILGKVTAGTVSGIWTPNHIDNTRYFVRQHYVDFFSREPDGSGLNFWLGQFTSCGTTQSCIDGRRINTSGAFFVSIEFQETGYLVYRTYKTSFGDTVSPGVTGSVPIVRLNEFLPDTQQIGRGVIVNQGNWQAQLEANKVAFFKDFVTRPRWVSGAPTTMTPAQLVDALFLNAGVTPTTPDRQAAINEFGGASNTANTDARARALRRVAENPTLSQLEYNRAFVLMQYFGYLRRNPDDAPDSNYAGWKFWLGKLNDFNGNYVAAEMVKGFITSPEYRQRFGQ